MPAIGDVYRVIAKGRLLGTVETRNMFTYCLTAAGATEDEIAIALEAHIAGMFSTFAPSLANVWHLYETETEKHHAAVPPAKAYWLGYHTTDQDVTGGQTADMSAFQDAVLFIFETGVKREIGRKFLAGVTEGVTLNGSFIPLFLVNCGIFLATMLEPVTMGTGGDASAGVLGKGDVFHGFVSGTVGSIISTMRRRKPGYGI